MTTSSITPQATESRPRHLFGTDGIRGLANEPPMTPEIAFAVGVAISQVARHNNRPAKIVVGKDTRLSGYMLETALASGICAMGGRVLLCGPIPTPAVAYLTTSMRADAGVVISASHNPFYDNGIKIFGRDGFKLPDHQEQEIERFIASMYEHDPSLFEGFRFVHQARPTEDAVGSAERVETAGGRYVTFAKGTFPKELTLEGIRIVVDAAHGAAYKVAPTVFEELGADIIPIGIQPNGRNINHECGALHPEHMREIVLNHRANVGIALDGDADRVIIVDEKGSTVDGDVIMALCGSRMMQRQELKGGAVVATVMSNLGLEHALQNIGASLIRTQVGDRYVVESMRAGGFCFGGEQSGHLIFLDHCSTGDGIVAALQLLAIMVREQNPLSQLASRAMTRVPQVLESIRLQSKKPLDLMPKLSSAIASFERDLGLEGRLLVRWSGTEPKLRIMVEGPNLDRIQTMALALCEAAQEDTQL